MAAKRRFDFVGATLLLIAAAPALIVAALAIRFSMGSPVLFRQLRPGLHGKAFTLYKLRTMTDSRDCRGVLLADDERLTAIGRAVRRWSLDELPQLFNVLKGDMSLVGPRPLLMEYLPLYSARQARRHDVLPGITGWAQVHGRNALSWEERFELDVWYVEHRTFALDLRILLLTLGNVLRGSGVSQDGYATAQRFTGTPADGAKAGHDRRAGVAKDGISR